MKNVIAFVKEHYPLALVIAAVGALFIYGQFDKFSEFAYGTLRLGVVVLVAFGVIDLVFKSTIRPYIHSGLLVTDFNSLPGEKRLYVALGVIGLIIYTALQCYVHP